MMINPSTRNAQVCNRGISEFGCEIYTSPPSSWDVSQEKMSTLPSEICKIIMDILFTDIFGPKRLHPKLDQSVMPIFLALSKQSYDKYRKVYWSQNTWIIGKGPVNDSMRFMTLAPYDASTTEFSKQKPNEAALTIRRAEVLFSKDDLQSPQIVRAKEARGSQSNGEHEHREDCSTYYEIDSKTFIASLVQIWQDKFDRIAFLGLDCLVLDFSQAYGPDASFLGVTAAQRFLPFIHRVPVELKIVAPTEMLEKEIRSVFQELNKPATVLAGSSPGDSA